MPVIGIGISSARVYLRKIYYPTRRGRALSEITVQTLKLARAHERERDDQLAEDIYPYPRWLFFQQVDSLTLTRGTREKICAFESETNEPTDDG